MFKKRIILAAALGAAMTFASPAISATTLPQDNTSPGPTLVFTGGLATATFGANYPTSGSFTDYFFFTLDSAANITSGLVSTNAEGGDKKLTNDLDISIVDLGTGATTLLTFVSNSSDKNQTLQLSAASLPYSLAAGTYRLAVFGDVQAPPAFYTGSMEFAAAVSAVPEPSAWAMMLLGFGGIGYAMRRRRKVAGRHTQAA